MTRLVRIMRIMADVCCVMVAEVVGSMVGPEVQVAANAWKTPAFWNIDYEGVRQSW